METVEVEMSEDIMILREQLGWSWDKTVEEWEAFMLAMWEMEDWDEPAGPRYDCPVCEEEVLRHKTQVHHTSYEPEEVMRVCYRCHDSIHRDNGKHEELQPEKKRSEVEGPITTHGIMEDV